jgi:hypothetical protein
MRQAQASASEGLVGITLEVHSDAVLGQWDLVSDLFGEIEGGIYKQRSYEEQSEELQSDDDTELWFGKFDEALARLGDLARKELKAAQRGEPPDLEATDQA